MGRENESYKNGYRNLTGGPAAKTPLSQRKGRKSDPWSGNQILHAATKTQCGQINKFFFLIKKEKNGYRASVGDDEKFLKINGDGCNILWMYVLPLNHILKMTKMIHLCYVYFITKHTFFLKSFHTASRKASKQTSSPP